MLNIILEQIDKEVDVWVKKAEEYGKKLVYYIPKKGSIRPDEIPLFASPEDYEGAKSEDKWLVPNALRVIEPESVIHVIK
jgi:hypothetical protein